MANDFIGTINGEPIDGSNESSGSVSLLTGIIKSSSSDSGDFTLVQDWQGDDTSGYTSNIQHDKALTKPYSVQCKFYQYDGTTYEEIIPSKLEIIDGNNVKVYMPISSDLYINMI